MEKPVADELRARCLKARKSKKPHRFFYCQVSANGNPVLLVGRRLMPTEIRDLRRNAQKKKFLTGVVQGEGSRLVFRAEEPGKRLILHLQRYFGKQVPLLKQALVLGLEDPLPEEDGGDSQMRDAVQDRKAARQAQLKAEALQEEAKTARKEEWEARQRIESIAAKMAEAKEEWEALGADADEMAEQARQRQGELEGVFGALKGFMRGRRSRSDREGKAAETAYKAMMRREAAEVRRKAYESLAAELELARGDLKAGQAQLMELDAEIEQAKASEVAHRSTADLARSSSASRAALYYHLDDVLEDTLHDDPTIGPVFDVAKAQDEKADALADAAMDLQMEIEALSVKRAALAESLSEESTPERLAELAALERTIQERESALTDTIRHTEDAAAGAKAARKRVMKLIRVSKSTEVTGSYKAARQAKRKLGNASEIEADAEEALEQSKADLQDATRRRAVELVAIQARAAIGRHAPVYAELGTINPHNPEHISEHGDKLGQPGVINALADARHFYTLLCEAGATEAELSEVFASVPSDWRPPQLTDHMQWFAKLDAWETSMTSNESDEDRLKRIEAEMAGTELLERVDVNNQESRRMMERQLKAFQAAQGKGRDKLFDVVDPNLLGSLVDTLQLLNDINQVRDLVGDLKDGKEAGEQKTVFDRETGKHVPIDPVSRKMLDEQLMGAIRSIGPAGLTLLRGVTDMTGFAIPGLTQLLRGNDLIKQITEATKRVGQSMIDTQLLEEAEEGDHVGTEALKQSQNRERMLATRSTVEAALTGIDIAADAAMLTGVGGMAGMICKVAGASGGLASQVAHGTQEFRIANKAKKLFAQARDEDLDPSTRSEAARKLFEYSQKHAKGLLAWLATEGDPIAMKYARARGLTDAEIQRTTPAVLQRFLLQRAGEGKGEQRSFTEWLDDLTAWWRGLFGRIGEAIARWGRGVAKWVDEVKNGAVDALLNLTSPPIEAIEGLVSALTQLSDKRTFLAARPSSERIEGYLTQIDTARSIFDKEAARQRGVIAESLDQLAGHTTTLSQLSQTGETERALSRVQELSSRNVQMMQQLSSLA
ncbi:MAG: hypothetical protein ACI8RZ_000372 [Myxococcota bacterium]|jgi:hypothetical protein